MGQKSKLDGGYSAALEQIAAVIADARRRAARAVNATMTATYWMIGRRIVEEEQRGSKRADYGEELVERLGVALTARFGRGFGARNLWRMRSFFLAYPAILSPVSSELPARRGRKILSTLSSESPRDQLASVAARLPLPWWHYVRLLAVKSEQARRFYEEESVRGGWTVRQLRRQIDSQFYERTLLSRNKEAMLAKGQVATAMDAVTPEEEIKDPFVLEFLGLKRTARVGSRGRLGGEAQGCREAEVAASREPDEEDGGWRAGRITRAAEEGAAKARGILSRGRFGAWRGQGACRWSRGGARDGGESEVDAADGAAV
jgi:hypothetical protein